MTRPPGFTGTMAYRGPANHGALRDPVAPPPTWVELSGLQAGTTIKTHVCCRHDANGSLWRLARVCRRALFLGLSCLSGSGSEGATKCIIARRDACTDVLAKKMQTRDREELGTCEGNEHGQQQATSLRHV